MARPHALIPVGSWPRLMKADMAAAYLDCSPGTIRAMAARGELPAPRPDGKWDRAEIDSHLNRNCVSDGALDESDLLQRLEHGTYQSALSR